mmetsp:Transcript_15688/g.24079  ORF Transcript_15688/g.24079 Transcript_15688/m.24079 type:complete len:83 (-) Transcript_15688:2933-3181(-)
MENISKEQEEKVDKTLKIDCQNLFVDNIKGNSKIQTAMNKPSDGKCSPHRNAGLSNSENHGHVHSCQQSHTFGCSGGCNPSA